MQITAIAGQDQFGAFIEYNGFRSAMPNYELAVYVVNILALPRHAEDCPCTCEPLSESALLDYRKRLALDIAKGQNTGR